MAKFDYDDGLVHGHRWATEPQRPSSVTAYCVEPTDEPFDDGLVHGHNWAAEKASS